MNMVKIKTADLIGDGLDYAVALALGEAKYGLFSRFTRRLCANQSCTSVRPLPEYSTDWQHGGPIIERERIGIVPSVRLTDRCSKYWIANLREVVGVERGPTPLIAAMRAFVASKLGSEVEVPEASA